ncbi:pre-mRNA-splicing factor cwc22 [Diplodia intermedia]|uniref:Pre-mRNA-splicing factor cwc22 n=1 Tax=Diplodia intermedia TaxID=856260 RepID=A0ABR3TUZ9_9PEZI
MEIESAVRIPSPEPERPRKRSPPSRSPSPRRYRSPPRGRSRTISPDRRDDDRAHDRDRDRQRDLEFRARQPSTPKPVTEEQKQAAAKAEYEKLLNMRSGGTYIPPARLRALQAQITDKTSKEYQRMAWEALKKSVNGLINKVNVSNIKFIVPELFNENLVRGRGLFCRSIMKAQAASLPFTPIYAAMVAIVNTKLPQVGELLVTRLVVQFRKAFKRNDKAVCLSSTTFLAHLVNQQVVHEMLAAQILLLLLHKPTDDSVEIAVGLTREVGQHLEEMSQPIALAVFDQFRNILHEADIDKRTQYMVEVLFQVRKDKYKDNPAVRDELDLVEEEDQITHKVGLDDEGLEVQDGLNIFKYDSEWQEHEDAYKQLKAEILGEAEGSDDDEEYESDESSDEEEEKKDRELEIKDQTNTDLVNLRRTIYLTIKSSGGFEECCHKLMKINLPAGYESELPSMVVECASQERTYDKFYGLIGERFAKLNRLWRDLFEESFVKHYDTIHRYETNRLRIVAQFFGHLLASDAIGWHVLSSIRLNENQTTSSSRIFIKILFEDLAQSMSMKKLAERMREDTLQPYFDGVFPKDESRNTRFAINFFTAIGMGVLTEDMREYLKNMPKPAPPPALPEPESDAESASSYSSYSITIKKPPCKESVKVGVVHSSATPQARQELLGFDLAQQVTHSRSSAYGPLIQRLRLTITTTSTQTSHVVDVPFSIAEEEWTRERLALAFAHTSASSTKGSQPFCISLAQPGSPQKPQPKLLVALAQPCAKGQGPPVQHFPVEEPEPVTGAETQVSSQPRRQR